MNIILPINAISKFCSKQLFNSFTFATMNINGKLSLLILMLILRLGVVNGQNNEVIVSLLTCSPGNEIYSIYGHNALRIQDRNTNSDIVFNYGTFDFDTPGFTLKFLRGKLPYLLSVAEYNDFMYEYHFYNRSVTEQILDIDSIAKNNILNFLRNNLQPENRAYKYDFFNDNCATRLRNILDKNIVGLNWDENAASHKTYRQIIKEYQQNIPWTNFGIDLIIGMPADRKTTLKEEVFIPDYLANAVTTATVDNKKLQFIKRTLLEFEKNAAIPMFIMRPEFLFIILLLLELFILFKAYHRKKVAFVKKYDGLWVVIVSFTGILMLFMWFGTDHHPTKYNLNILWSNLLIPVWYFYGRYNKKWSTIFFVIILLCLAISFMNAMIQILPQYFHPVVAIISLILILKGWRIYKFQELETYQPITLK